MKGAGDEKQNASQEIEGKPDGHEAAKKLNDPKRGGEMGNLRLFLSSESLETGSADYASLMFRDALPAEGATAREAPGDRFSGCMMKAPLPCQIGHDLLPLRFLNHWPKNSE